MAINTIDLHNICENTDLLFLSEGCKQSSLIRGFEMEERWLWAIPEGYLEVIFSSKAYVWGP